MAKLIQRNNDQKFEREQRKRKTIRNVTICLCGIAIIGMVAYGVNSYIHKTFNNYKVIRSIKREDSNTVKYIFHGNKTIKYSRDGASCFDSGGQVVWNGSYDFKNPNIDSCGDFVAIADIGATEAIVYDGKNSGTSIHTTLPIAKVQVANQGVTALLLEDEDSNVISIYVPTTTGMDLRATVPTNVQSDGFPIDFAISDDGQRLVTSYMQLANGVMENKVTFHNFGDVGQSMSNKVAGFKSFGQNIIAKVDFLNNRTVCAYGQNGFTLFKFNQKPSDIKTTITFEHTIKSTFSNSGYVGFVLENFEDTSKYIIQVFNLSGNKVLEKGINFDYSTVFLSGKEIVFYKDLECHILKLNGEFKFQGTFDKNIEYIMPINNYDKYLLIDSMNLEYIKLTEEN